MADRADVRLLFSPRSIAVIGASVTAGAPGTLALQLLVDRGYSGTILPVNPRYAELAGRIAYPRLAALPEVPDLAIVAVPANSAVEAVSECASTRVPFALVLSAGFAETGAEGARLQDALVAAARTGPTRLIGPNTLGLFNVAGNVPAGFGLGRPGLSLPHPGRLAILAQSGGMGLALLNRATAAGIGVSFFAATGNEADLTILDLLEFVVDDSETAVVVMFAETFRDAERLPDLAQRARAAGKPMLLAKVGRSDPGRRAAHAHTGADTGDDAAYDRLFAETGILRVEDVDELFDTALFLERGRVPAGPRVAVITPTGGAGAWLCECLAAAGLEVPPASRALRDRLRTLVPGFAAVGNPVDVTPAGNTREAYRSVAQALSESGEYDALAVVVPLLEQAQVLGSESMVEAVAMSSTIPVIGYSHWVPVPALGSRLGDLAIPFATSPRRAAAVLAAAERYGRLA